MLTDMSFLNQFAATHPTVKRCVSEIDFGSDLGNYKKDVPVYNQYNNGLAVCEEGYERQNLQLDGNSQPINLNPQVQMDQELSRLPGSSEQQARGVYLGKEMAPLVDGQSPGSRPGLTGYIPSVEEGMAQGMMSQASNGVTTIGGNDPFVNALDPAAQQERQRAMRLRGFSLQ